MSTKIATVTNKSIMINNSISHESFLLACCQSLIKSNQIQFNFIIQRRKLIWSDVQRIHRARTKIHQITQQRQSMKRKVHRRLGLLRPVFSRSVPAGFSRPFKIKTPLTFPRNMILMKETFCELS